MSLTWRGLSGVECVCFRVCVMAILPVSLLSVHFVFVAVTFVFLSIISLVTVVAAVPVMVFMVSMASVGPVISGRCPAATPPVPGPQLPPLASSWSGLSRCGLADGVPLQA